MSDKPFPAAPPTDANPVRTRPGQSKLEDVAPHQVRAARGLLGWSAAHLAQLAGIRFDDLIAFETDGYLLGAIEYFRLQDVLRGAGVQFIGLGDGLGRGVRLTAPPSGGSLMIAGPPKRRRPWA